MARKVPFDGAILSSARIACGVESKDLADAADISVGDLGRIEASRGAKLPVLKRVCDKLRELCEGFRIEVDRRGRDFQPAMLIGGDWASLGPSRSKSKPVHPKPSKSRRRRERRRNR